MTHGTPKCQCLLKRLWELIGMCIIIKDNIFLTLITHIEVNIISTNQYHQKKTSKYPFELILLLFLFYYVQIMSDDE